MPLPLLGSVENLDRSTFSRSSRRGVELNSQVISLCPSLNNDAVPSVDTGG